MSKPPSAPCSPAPSHRPRQARSGRLASASDTAALDAFSRLLTGLYRIPLHTGNRSTDAWQPWLTALRESFACNFAVLILRPPSAIDAGVNLASGPDYDPGNDIYRSSAGMDPFVNLPSGQVVTLAEYVDDSRLRASEFYKVCLKPSNIFHIMGMDFPTVSGLRTGMRLCRPESGGAFVDAEREALARLLPHLQQAIELYHRLNHMDLERSLYAGALTQLSVATLLLDQDLRIYGANPIAEHLLEERDGARRADDTLVLTRRRDQQQLRELVLHAIEARQTGTPTLAGAMPVERPSGRAPLGLVVRPLPDATDQHRSGPCVSVFISDPERPTEASADILGQLFTLTPAEARLALLLANGQSLEQAAAELGITRNTGRAHLRSIFTKTGVSQQTQLVSLILKSVANLS